MLYLGDHAKVAAAFEKKMPLLVDSLPLVKGECGSCYARPGEPSKTHHREGYVLVKYGPDAHGPYRAGDPLPDDVIAIG